MEMISCRRAGIVPGPYQRIGARSLKASRFLLSSRSAVSRWEGRRASLQTEGSERPQAASASDV